MIISNGTNGICTVKTEFYVMLKSRVILHVRVKPRTGTENRLKGGQFKQDLNLFRASRAREHSCTSSPHLRLATSPFIALQACTFRPQAYGI